MSSLYAPFTCNLAFDGNVYGQNNNFAHSNNDANPHITVDLGIQTSVNSIKIFNRYDCCQRRLDFFEVYVGNSPLWSQNTRCDPANIPTTTIGLAYNAALFPCPLTGRYASIRIPPGVGWPRDGYLHIAEMQVFANNGCPAQVATGATMMAGSVCTGAGWGAICAYTCNPGWVEQSGSEISRCNGAIWDSPPLVCRPPCADLLAPQYSSSCAQTLYTDNFNVDGSLNRLVSLDPNNEPLGIPSNNPPLRAKWFQQDGFLQSSARVACSQDLGVFISSAQIYNFDGPFTVSASVNTVTRAGLIFRAQSNQNYMRFWFDTVQKLGAIERIINGVAFTVQTVYSGLFSGGDWHAVAVRVAAQQMNVSFDGVQIMSTNDRSLLIGSAGLYAQSSAFFDNLAYSTQCTGMCSQMTDSNVCTFGCQDGLIAVGPVSRVCRGTASVLATTYNPDALAFPLVCTLPAPTFLPSTLYVLENAPVNALVGDPLVAYSTSPDFQVQFQILAVYAAGAFQVPGFNQSLVVNQGLFWVDICSGQVKLRTGGQDVMNFEGVNTYVLTMSAFVSGFVGAQTVRNVTVFVLNQDEHPVIVSTPAAAPILLSENAGAFKNGTAQVWLNNAGAFVGAVSQWDPENSTLAFILSVDGSAGRLVMDNATGVVSVPSSLAGPNGTSSLVPVNFETTSGSGIQLNVRVVQVNDSMMVSQATITVPEVVGKLDL